MDFLHETIPTAIALTVGPLTVYWYGIILACAVVVGLIVIYYAFKKKQVRTEHLYNLFFLLVVFCIIGGRIGHVIGNFEYYSNDPIKIITFWEGGIVFHGVLLAGLITVILYARIKRIRLWLLTDSIVLGLPLMQSIGRWGNYFNQEVYGTPSDAPWAIVIDAAHRLPGYEDGVLFHPLFLYESLLMLVVFVILFSVFRTRSLQPGRLTLIYFILWAIVRFSLDFLRIEMLELGPLLLTQWITLALFMGAIILLVRFRKRELPDVNREHRKNSKEY